MAMPHEKYTGGDYLRDNPSWDLEDSPWKAGLIADFLAGNGMAPASLCEIGCGAGGVLAALRDRLPGAELCGYEIAPAAAAFWDRFRGRKIDFVTGDFFALNKRNYDVVLLADVIEHIPDPFAFLNGLHGTAASFVFYIPLDLSALSVLREAPILKVRRKVGHINYFTKTLALELLRECGFEVTAWKYTGAYLNTPQSSWKTRLAALPRLAACAVNKDLGVRLLGGETLLALAHSSGKRPCA